MKIGFSELIIIFVVALIVIGPEKLPEYARKLGESLKAFRNVSNDLTKDIRESVIEPLEEAQKPIKEAMQPVTEVADEIRKNIDDVKKSVNDIGKASSVKPEAKTVDKIEEKAEETPEGDGKAEEAETEMQTGSIPIIQEKSVAAETDKSADSDTAEEADAAEKTDSTSTGAPDEGSSEGKAV